MTEITRNTLRAYIEDSLTDAETARVVAQARAFNACARRPSTRRGPPRG